MPGARPRPRAAAPAATPQLIADMAANYIASRGRDVGIVELAPNLWEQMIADALETDPRFVQTGRLRWQLASTVREREKAMVA
jgi:hypothetical protein